MARRRSAPFVAVRTDIRKEERVRFIADHAGYNEDEALGKLVRLWCWCTDRGLEDAPEDCTGYAVPDAVVRRFLGPRGLEALLGDGCDELAMGVRRPDGLIYLRGTDDTVERLRKLRAGASAGGLARHASAVRSAGRFVSYPTVDAVSAELDIPPETSGGTQSLQLADQPPPASTSEIPDPRSLPEIGTLSPRARATPEPVRAEPASFVDRDLAAARARGDLALATWRRLSNLRLEHAARLKLEGVLPLPTITPANEPGGFRDLRERIREEGDLAARACERVLQALDEAATATRSIEWLDEKAFRSGAWNKSRSAVPKPKRKPAQASPLPAPIATGERADPADFAAARAALGFVVGGKAP